MYTLSRYPKGGMDRLELNRMMKLWPKIMREVSNPWAKRFSADVWERHSDPVWLPTLKQAHFIRILYIEFIGKDEEVYLVED